MYYLIVSRKENEFIESFFNRPVIILLQLFYPQIKKGHIYRDVPYQ